MRTTLRMPLLLLTVLLSTRAASAQQPVTADSVVYRLASSSSLQVKTGKAGLFGFAGHSHLIQARAFAGEIVYYPRDPSSSRLNIRVLANSLEVLTPHDTAEIRQVTETMRTKVLRTAKYPEIRLVSRRVEPNDRGFHIVAALTLAGQTRELPIDVATRIGADTLEATSTFSVKQTDFGIKPTSAGPGGTVKVANRVTFEIRAIAVRAGTRHEDVQAAWVRSNGGQRPDSVEATGEGPCRIALTRPGAVYSFLGCRTDL